MLVLSLKFFPLMEEKLALYGTFFLFAAILIASLPIVYFTLPETKDLGLELIRYYFTPPQTIFYIDLNEKIPDWRPNTPGESSKPFWNQIFLSFNDSLASSHLSKM